MRVPARVYATEALARAMDDAVLDQVTNVATLPGIVRAALCMPDGHSGYGFPIGGVAATDPERGGVVSPGGIGFDINCGMRLVRTNLTLDEVRPRLDELVTKLAERVPAGVGTQGLLDLTRNQLRRLVEEGAPYCVRRGLGWSDDLELTEDGGVALGADSSKVSDQALSRGLKQVGTLGSGNHYLEVQVVREGDVRDESTARSFGITRANQVVVMFHCGSRGFGHQVATDYLKRFARVMESAYGIRVPDRELASAPVDSPDGQDYLAAMSCAINMGFANRQAILHRIREVFAEVFGRPAETLGMHMVYDVTHNTAKLERHRVGGGERTLLVHRKGATRALGPGHPELPLRYRSAGQPVILGGSMESGSYLLAGAPDGAAAFFSTAHGAGRTMSRARARKTWNGRKLQREMADRGIIIRASSWKGLAEEAGGAYKDIDEVVEATEKAGLSRAVCRFTPIANVKG